MIKRHFTWYHRHMKNETFLDIQKTMFSQEKTFLEMASIFEVLSSDCRLEIIYLLSSVKELPSGEISRLTNCSPSQTSQYLTKMLRAKIVIKNRSWREVSYSLNMWNPLVADLLSIIKKHFSF